MPVPDLHIFDLIIAGVSSLNIALVAYLIKKSGDQATEFRRSIKEISASIPVQLDKAIERFDKLCHERQLSCSSRQDVQVGSMCTRLDHYASLNDTQWAELTRRREQVWENHKIEMNKIWDAIHSHSHTETGEVIR